jgi:predicted ABC-type ATPase/nicotinic acid mononucleotide adenylyltransferase
MNENATFTFGRFNPPHAGHGKLISAVQDHAASSGGDHYIFPSHTVDHKKNPLAHGEKVHFLRKLFPKANIADHAQVRTPLDAVKHLESKGHKHITMVVGDDRVKSMQDLFNQYKGKEFHAHVQVKSAGVRDPDSDDEVEALSASKLRDHAKKGNFKDFAKGVPVKKHAKDLYHAVRRGLRLEMFIPHFKALFLVGGPGSGKDFLIHSVLDECKLKEVSLDKIFEAIVNQTNIDEVYDFPSIIVNGNADNKDKILVTKAILETMGYDTAMVYVYTTDESSKKRNDERIASGAKTFKEHTRKTKYNNSISYLNEYVDMFESFALYDNSSNYSTVNEEKKVEITSWLVELSETISGFLSKLPANTSAIEWIHERVLEVGTDETAQFARALTPGQGSNNVRTYAEADKLVGKQRLPKSLERILPTDKTGDPPRGVPSASYKSPTRTTAEAKEIQAAKDVAQSSQVKGGKKNNISKKTKSSISPSVPGEVRNMAVGSMGVASAPVGFTMNNGDQSPFADGKAKMLVGGVVAKKGGKNKTKLYPRLAPVTPLQMNNNSVSSAGIGLTAYKVESKSFDEIRNNISSKIHNFDEDLKEGK